MTRSSEARIARQKRVKESIRNAPGPLSLSEIRKGFRESERTIERDMQEMTEMEIISYNEDERTYSISNSELVRASEEQIKKLSSVSKKDIMDAVLPIVRLARKLDSKNLGEMDDTRALKFMLDKVNKEFFGDDSERISP
jgi:DNA invertase Pin-like site-specific DNA recombinase